MDKSRFEHLVEKRMNKDKEGEKFDLNMIVEMMEQLGGLSPLDEAIEEKQNPYQTAFAAQEVGLTADQKRALRAIPKLDMSELGWAEPVGAGETTRISVKREQLESIFDDIRAGSLEETLQNLKQLLDGSLTGATVQQKINSLVTIKTITEMLANFNEKSAGFIFEPFMAALIGPGGKQVATDARILPDIQAGQKYYGLKLLAMRPGYVSGSARDLVNFFIKHPNKKVNYIVAYKGKTDVEIFIMPIGAAEAMQILADTTVKVSSKLPRDYLKRNLENINAEYNKIASKQITTDSTSFSALNKKATDKSALAKAIIQAMPSGKFGKFVLKPSDLSPHSKVKLPLGAQQVADSIQTVLGDITIKLATIMDAAAKTQQAVFNYAESGLADAEKGPAETAAADLKDKVADTKI